ncbi:MAG: TIGR02444 family protein [Nannocystaceae bacterium]
MESAATSDDLWSFAVRTYAREGVAAACLRLQDDHGLDVDVVLGCLWHARRGGTLDEAQLASMLAAAEPARRHIEQVRSVRRAVGSDREHEPRWQPTYERLRDAELEAERVELAGIETALREAPRSTTAGPPASLALASLQTYASRFAPPGDDQTRHRLLRDLVGLVLGDSEPPRAV